MTAEWHQLSEEAKEPHRKQTEIQKARYDAEMKVYKANKVETEAAANIKKTTVGADSKLSGKKRPASKSAEKKDAAKATPAAAKTQ